MSFSLYSFNPYRMKKTMAIDFAFSLLMITLFYLFFMIVTNQI
jgi:hypothetical protein